MTEAENYQCFACQNRWASTWIRVDVNGEPSQPVPLCVPCMERPVEDLARTLIKRLTGKEVQ